jgi:long-subunit fatty acid transport protein
MKRRGWSRLAGTAAGVSLAAWAGGAAADSGIDSPDSGVVQMGRGSAWVARADDPLAAYFNPAAMAFQATSVHVGAQLMMQSRCFTRVGPDGQPVSPGTGVPAPLLPGQAATGGGSPPQDQVCSAGGVFPNPQLGAVFRVADRVAIGLAVVAPHASGSNSWPESLSYTNSFGVQTTQPSPQRYLLTSSNALILYPTVSVAYAPLDNLSFGVGFVWGIGTVDFTTFSESISTMPPAGTTATDHFAGDVKSQLTAKDLFIPGLVLSALWMPTSNLDVAAWFKWQDALKADTDLLLTANYWNTSGALNKTACPAPFVGCNLSRNAPGTAAGTIDFQIPMEAKLGLRFHMPRKDIESQPGWATTPGRKVRDPLSQDVFDVEVDFTWANNSAVQNINLQFNTNPVIPIEPGNLGKVPANGDIPHLWKDVVGIRVGGDVAVVPNRLSLRAGGFYETPGQNANTLNLDFDLAQKIGLSGGATLRVGMFDLSAGYQHTFYGTLNNGGNGSVYALSGDASGTSDGACGTNPANPTIGKGCFRSWQAVNGGSLRESLNEVGFSATVRF